MRSTHSLHRFLPRPRAALAASLLFAILACNGDDLGGPEPAGPLTDEAAFAKSGQRAMRGAGLLVGDVNFLVTDGVRRYDGRGDFVDVIVPVGTAGVTVPCCITFGPDDHLYVSSPFSSEVFRFNGVTGEYIDTFIGAGSGGLIVPLILVFHRGHLYVGDLGDRAIRRYDATTGAFVDEFVPPFSPGLGDGDPQAFAFGPDGNLYVAAITGGRVLRYDGDTGAFIDDFVPPNPDLPDPDGLTFGPDGKLYVGSFALHRIWRYDIATGAGEEFVPSGSGGLNGPVGFEFGPDGNLYVTSLHSSQILAYHGRTGAFLGAFVDTGEGGLSGPRTLTFKADVRMCHRPPGNEAKARTIRVAYLDGLDHVAHGDEVGRCG